MEPVAIESKFLVEDIDIRAVWSGDLERAVDVEICFRVSVERPE
jgi:hypothetical protein